jgi:hypothetical protein
VIPNRPHWSHKAGLELLLVDVARAIDASFDAIEQLLHPFVIPLRTGVEDLWHETMQISFTSVGA